MTVLFCDVDTPGSFLAGRNPAELKNEELCFWLKCRNDLAKGLHTDAQLVKQSALELFQRSNGCLDVYTVVYARSKLINLCIWPVVFPKRIMTL